jgi:hypothetical protein
VPQLANYDRGNLDLAIELLKNAVGVNKNQVVEGRGVCDDNHRELNFPAVSKS